MQNDWLFTALALPAALAWSADPAARPRSVTAGSGDNGAQVPLSIGDALVLRMRADPATGRCWRIAEFDAARLAPAGETFVAQGLEDPAMRPVIGAPEHQILRFVALAAGSAPLELRYAPFAEPIPVDAPSFTLIAQIRRPG